MKQRPDESPDQWVRQIISQLPDAPPPGSSFDSERLWAQLRPELQVKSSRRKTGWAWLAAAACLTGLTLGWFWLHESTHERSEMATQESKHKADAPMVSRRAPNPARETGRPKFVVAEKERLVLGARSRQHEKPKPKPTPRAHEPLETVPQIPDLPTIAEVPFIAEKWPESNKSNVAMMAAPKRRFRLVHENELRAEEESRPKLYRPENFVRIGTGDHSESASDESRPVLTLPLTHKPNQ